MTNTNNRSFSYETYFPIRFLSDKTGVGTSTLRAWERRYGLLSPQRTPKGHRLYNNEDIQRIARILTLLEDGHTLPSIAQQLKHGIASGKQSFKPEQLEDEWGKYLNNNLQAIYDFSPERVESIYNRVSSLYPIDMITERLIEPTLNHLATSVKDKHTGISEELFYTNWIRSRLGSHFHHSLSQATGSRIVLACTPDCNHDIKLMLFAISALTRGYRVLYLGTGLPLNQIPFIVERSGSRAVILISRDPIDITLQQQLSELSTQLNVPLCLTGTGSEQTLPDFESAGGIRLGSRMGIALRVLGSHIAAHSVTEKRQHQHITQAANGPTNE